MRRKTLGRLGEWLALLWLLLHGYRVRSRNWRGAGGELDLVVERRGEIVFVEVKTRSGINYGGPLGAVDRHKRETLARAASAYLGRHDLWRRPCRFDVVAIQRKPKPPYLSITHRVDAFSPDLGRRVV